jgi:hypothetical protein
MSAHAASSDGHGEHAPTGPAADSQEPRRGWLGDPRRCATADGLLLVLAAATVAVCLLQSHGAARLLLVLAAACLIPGCAVLTRLSVEDELEAFGLAVGFGFTIEAFGALAMVWTGWWHPFGWAIALGAVACALLAVDLRRNLAISGESM